MSRKKVNQKKPSAKELQAENKELKAKLADYHQWLESEQFTRNKNIELALADLDGEGADARRTFFAMSVQFAANPANHFDEEDERIITKQFEVLNFLQ